MLISEICIKRPVFATVLSIVIVLLGVMFFTNLQIRGTPNIDPPIITIDAHYHGSDALYMEQNITNRIEKILRTVKNVEHIQSTSQAGNSNIVITFNIDADINEALNDVKSKVASISSSLPTDMPTPSVEKMDSDAWPGLWIVAKSDRHDDMHLTDILYQHTVKELEKISSVGKVKLFGARWYTMSIMPDPTALYALKITPLELEGAIKSQSKDYPVGSIKTVAHNYILELKGKLSSEEEFRNIIVRSDKHGVIKLGQVANVRLEPYDEDAILKHNGVKSIAIGIIKQSKANVIELSHDVSGHLSELQSHLPQGVTLEVAYDSAVSVEKSIKGVVLTIIEALLLVTGVVYLFLKSPTITIIPFVTIPVSLIGTFSFMYALGFSVNIFTLLAMTLAIGLVVDDAIVMLENIFRHHESGSDAKTASLTASREIGFAIMAMTITLAAVFLPVGFIKGFVGKIFIEFAWTLAFCVLVSGFVALTLTPMMASRMVGAKHHEPPKFVAQFQELLSYLETKYMFYLHYIFEHNKAFWIICGSNIAVLVLSLILVNKTFTPDEDVGFLLLNAFGPEGSNISRSSVAIDEAEKILELRKDIKGYFTITNDDNAFGFILLQDIHDRNKSQQTIRDELMTKLSGIPEMSIYLSNPGSMISGDKKNDVEFHIYSDSEWSDLDHFAHQITESMNKSGIFNGVENAFKTSTPTIDVHVNRDKAYKYGIRLEDVGNTLQYLLAGKKVSDFSIGNDTYEVNLRYDKNDKNKISDIGKIFLKNANNEMMYLSAIADIHEKISIKSYAHYNSDKSVTISAGLSAGYKVSDAIKFIDELKDQYDLKEHNMSLEYLGEIQRMNESNASMLATFGLALLFIYLVLSAQFESFKDPLIILCAVPFSISGGVLSLVLGFDSINLYSNIGLVTLIGLVTKNSIMIVEFANQLREQGLSAFEAVTQSAQLRLRPILMTSIATICGSLPLVFASDIGSEPRRSIGLVIVGGMLIGTLFTIFIIPVLYRKFKT